ncbi:SDR family oxidoreductase [Variovorax humicola]|uniref:SDR family oxidoreductase n=1 Tax=Variovorax humicola TaxID=1769758 RepID=A0ABU8VVB5_9BURK
MSNVVLLTGGSGGIGRAIIEVLVRKYTVVSFDSSKNEFCHPRLNSVIVDISREQELLEVLKYLRSTYEMPYALINNAGVSEPYPFAQTPLDTWNRQILVNLTAPFILSREFAAYSPSPGFTRKIVNIASVSGMVGMPRYAAYNCSKAGLIALTRTLAIELAPDIHTCAICPGYIRTPMQVAEHSEEKLTACANENPSKRLGKPSEIAELVEFILSGKNAYLNGSIITVDGGETSGGMASKK